MNYKQFLYYKLAEEAAEVAHAAIKCAMYTPDTMSKNKITSRLEELRIELMDVAATIKCLQEADEYIYVDMDLIPAKMLKTKACYEKSKAEWS